MGTSSSERPGVHVPSGRALLRCAMPRPRFDDPTAEQAVANVMREAERQKRAAGDVGARLRAGRKGKR